MTTRRRFEAKLAVGDVTVTERDVEMLRAIERHGSMSAAAEALGRSYPHLQRRVVALESAVGSLTTRRRGGAGGGGTDLTAEARELIRTYDRLRVGLSGVTTVSESVLSGRVLERDGELARIDTPAGVIAARAPRGADLVDVALRADAIVLLEPGSPERAHTSLRNQLPGTVVDVSTERNVATVDVEVGEGVVLGAMVTVESVERLGLEAGRSIVAAFKSTAARATPVAE
ncbi:MAG: TOBE domain-containing protein [Halobacteriales archaeon]